MATMLIGFATGLSKTNGKSDGEILQNCGCDRIYSADHGVFAFHQMMIYLRPGDVAVVTDLVRLGDDIATILSTVRELHFAKVALHVVGTEIVPGTPTGDAFPQVCAILAEHHSEASRRNLSRAAKSRTRGRPPALTAEKKTHVERLLRAARMSVGEIAKALDISPATIYRYFPAGVQTARSRVRAGTAPETKLPAPPSPNAEAADPPEEPEVERFIIDSNITRFAEQFMMETVPQDRIRLRTLLIEEEDKLGRRTEQLDTVSRRMRECSERILKFESLIERSKTNGRDVATSERVLQNLRELRAIYEDHHRLLVDGLIRGPLP